MRNVTEGKTGIKYILLHFHRCSNFFSESYSLEATSQPVGGHVSYDVAFELGSYNNVV